MTTTTMTIFHPQLDENGEPVAVSRPTRSSHVSAWGDSGAVATFSITDPTLLPAVLNGIALTHAPFECLDWVRFAHELPAVAEPPFPATDKRRTSGLVIIEPDQRIWLVHPTNQFGGVEATFPKGRLEPGLTLAANAVKEGWEESGLDARPLEWLCDIERTKTITRYYLAFRAAGTPADMGWESQAVSLVPADQLAAFLNRPNDRKVLPALQTALKRLF